MDINQREARTFGKISALYEEARPGYPTQLISDIVHFSEISQADSVLDIGCGSGQVMLPFALRGYQVTGLDVSCEMIEIARKKCSSFSRVNFKTATFEDAELVDDSFNLITSGMAWHWVTASDRYKKASTILKDNGTVALFWSYQPRESSQLVGEVGKLLDSYGGPNRGPAGGRVNEIAQEVFQELCVSRLFQNVQRQEYDETIQMDASCYRNLVFSYGWVQGLSLENQQGLDRDLTRLLSQHLEPLLISYKHVLVMARKT